jgi:glycosyltransferase involved in cell wall biosynthesis
LNYIIIDGGSKDDSVAIIRKYERWLHFWVSEPDEGCTNAVNKGFAKATGQLFGIMCADDYYMPAGILKLVQLRSEKPDAICWVGGSPVIDLAGKIVGPGLPFIRDPKEIGDWGVGAWFAGMACLFSADAFRSLGAFDERFKTVNDVDLWAKFAKVGSFSLTNEIVASSRFNTQSLSHRDWPGEVVALIATNYVNGYHEVAKRILLRYAEGEVAKEKEASALNHITHTDPRWRLVPRSVLIKYVVCWLFDALKRRIFRFIPWQ